MKVASFPSLQGHVGNGARIAHELARAIGQIESYVMRNRKEPAASALMTAFLQHAITTIDTAGKVPRSIAITPATVSLAVAATQALVVTATLSDNTTAVVTPAASGTTYVSSDPTKATVSAAGLVTAVAVGTATITATHKGLTATKAVTVTA